FHSPSCKLSVPRVIAPLKMTRTSCLESLGVLMLLLAPGAGCATSAVPGAEKEAKPSDLDALKTVGAKANGVVVWTSARAGLPHIFAMKTDGSDLKQLTKGEKRDWSPRLSPDGQRVLFARSREKGFVPQHAASAPDTWNLFTVNVGGGEIKKVADN